MFWLRKVEKLGSDSADLVWCLRHGSCTEIEAASDTIMRPGPRREA